MPLADVDHRGQHQPRIVRPEQWRQADFDREGVAEGVQRMEHPAAAHGASLRRSHEGLTQPRVRGLVCGGHQRVDRAAQQFAVCMPEHAVEFLVDRDDQALFVDQNEAVRCGIESLGQQGRGCTHGPSVGCFQAPPRVCQASRKRARTQRSAGFRFLRAPGEKTCCKQGLPRPLMRVVARRTGEIRVRWSARCPNPATASGKAPAARPV
jgi:hypothetical protein